MRTRTLALAAAVLAAAATLGTAAARDRDRGDDREHEHRSGHHPSRGDLRRAGPVDPTYLKECGSCHAPYPARMLPAASWVAIMAGLERHFGENAELDPEVGAALERWLVERAGPDRRGAGGAPPLRITELSWFRDEHDEVPRDAPARPAIRSMANCTACHAGAASWDFDEDRVRIPRR